jgi:site-specific DNA-cytosine methylase
VDILLQTIAAHMPKAGLLENVPFLGYESPEEESGLEYIKVTLQELGYVVHAANFDLKDWHAVRRSRTRRMYSAHGVNQQHVHVVCSVASKCQH